jgi:hypothetical protein
VYLSLHGIGKYLAATMGRLKMKNIIAALLMLVSFNCFAFDEWSDADVKREAVYLAVDTVDWLQTRNIARNPDQFYETNSYLGKHPSVGKVNGYFATMMLVHVGIVTVLPSKHRSTFQFTSIFYELRCVNGNYQLGISAKFY